MAAAAPDQPVAQGDPKPRGGVASGPSNAARLSADAEGAVAQGDPKPGDAIREALTRPDVDGHDMQAALAALDELEKRVTIEWHNEQVQEFIDYQDALLARAEAAEAKVAELKDHEQAWVDAVVYYRNLAVMRGATPNEMRNDFDRGIAERGITSSEHDFDSFDDVAEHVEDWTTADALARAEAAEAKVSRLRRIFEVMASEDWRGNKPLHVTMAENALARLEQGDKE